MPDQDVEYGGVPMGGGTMRKFENMLGLPAYGPSPLQFSATDQGKHSEGLVVAFKTATKGAWTGNFQRGPARCDTVIQHPDGRNLIIVAGGEAYVVDPVAKRLVAIFGGLIEFCAELPELKSVVFADGLAVTILYGNGIWESTAQISWDGMRAITIDGNCLKGEAADPMTGDWVPFEVDLLEMTHSGGSYPSELA